MIVRCTGVGALWMLEVVSVSYAVGIVIAVLGVTGFSLSRRKQPSSEADRSGGWKLHPLSIALHALLALSIATLIAQQSGRIATIKTKNAKPGHEPGGVVPRHTPPPPPSLHVLQVAKSASGARHRPMSVHAHARINAARGMVVNSTATRWRAHRSNVTRARGTGVANKADRLESAFGA